MSESEKFTEMQTAFSENRIKPNLGRQSEVDLSRGFTAIILIICHVGLYLGNSMDTGLYVFSDIIGSEFGAPVFMALMGISVAFSRHSAPKDMAKRGIGLFAAGYALSFFRSILPLWIFGPIDEWTSVEAFLVVDILQFAGLTFLLFALFKKRSVPTVGILLISVGMVGVDQFLMLPESVPWKNAALTGLVDLFCPVSEWSCFPFLTWFFFPAFGLFFGEQLVRCQNKNRLYGILLPVSLAGVAYVYYQFHTLYPDYTDYYFGGNFYYLGIRNALLTACFICFSLSFWHFAGKALPRVICGFFVFLSKNLNLFYWISWLVIGLLIHAQAIAGWSFSARGTVGLMLLTLVICTVLLKLCRNIPQTVVGRSQKTQ